MRNTLAYTIPNHSGVSAIDTLYQFEQVFDRFLYYILEASENIFMDDIYMIYSQNMSDFNFASYRMSRNNPPPPTWEWLDNPLSKGDWVFIFSINTYKKSSPVSPDPLT